MTKSIFVLLFSCLGILVKAQDSDFEKVRQTLHYYLDGGTENDFETLKKAFHENATMRFIGRDGAYTEVNVLEFFGSRMKPGPAQNRQVRVVSIQVAGEVASAQVEAEYPGFVFVDFMHLVKIGGEWKIVNKIFHRRMKEAPSED